ncbi:peptide deformylase [Fodinibius halophilus]|uniref:Peptide deformylase n=1 Tax=Fodinibius halophilus TaxID=1736908 RepID=A0A6M1TBT1_9BACT|nr:peptide deformylase [Fodinibius halophilus]NGP89441.1 peptide deformylase [Fodinibius halophilus]
MSVLPIVTYDDEVLRKEAKPVEENSEELQALIEDMFDTMYNSDGVGLAAPQIGKLLRIFVADADPMTDEDGPTYGPIAMINPEITFESDREIDMDEGCLSIPGVNATVSRPEKIVVNYLDNNFKEQEFEVGGWWSRVIQHEADHLDGILFLDHLSLFKRKLLSSKLKEIAKGEKEIDYPVVSKKAQTQ